MTASMETNEPVDGNKSSKPTELIEEEMKHVLRNQSNNISKLLKVELKDGLTMTHIDTLLYDAAIKYCDANRLDEDDRYQCLGDLDGLITRASMELVTELYCENERLKTIIAQEN
jgi:hypothetical protein